MTLSPGNEKSKIAERLPLPGLAAISLYLLALAGVVILGVAGRHYPPLYLVLSAALSAASAGLLRLFRWAWAMARPRMCCRQPI